MYNDDDEKQEERLPYEPPRVIYDGELTTRAGSGGSDGLGPTLGKTSTDIYE